MPNTTWNPLDAHSRFTLSGGNLVATAAAISEDNGVAIVDGQSSGKYYIEITPTGTFGGNTCIGVNTLSPSWSSAISNDLSGSYLYFSSGTIYYNGTSSGFTVAAVASGNVICIALDLTNNKVWFRKNAGSWNGNATHDPATNTGGISIATLVATGRRWFVIAGAGLTATPVFTLNAGDTTFAQTVPSGFTSGWPTSGAVSNGATFDPATATGSIALSNGNLLVAAASNPTTPQRVKCIGAAATGKYYWEYYIDVRAGSIGCGVANANTLTDNFFTNATDGAALFSASTTGAIWVNGTNTVAAVAALVFAGGMVACVAVDFGARLAWFRSSNSLWNNNGAANPATGANGISISGLTGYLFPAITGQTNFAWRVALNNTDQTKIPPPAGFIVGPPATVPPTTALRRRVMVVG
jgi:hypothetical protein